MGAPTLVLVSGGLPPGSRDLVLARQMVADALGELAPRAGELGVRLGIEALHPMFCADRCVVSTLGQALDLAEQFPADQVGVVVDSYHVWWDPDLFAQIARAGAGDRIVSFQLCDWVVPLPADVLMGRGHLGDGSIDFAPMTAAVLATGYDGLVEVEIFNEDVWTAGPPPASARPSRCPHLPRLSWPSNPGLAVEPVPPRSGSTPVSTAKRRTSLTAAGSSGTLVSSW